MKLPKVVQRGKMTYVLYPEKVIVGTNSGQWISYNQYDNYNRQGITQFRNAIRESKEDEYANVVEQMSLAYKCGIKGSGTSRPKDVDL